MSRTLILRRAGPQATVQDLGRPGWMAEGLSRGGAADRLALAEGAALLGQPVGLAALELAGGGAEFEASEPMRIALTGAEAEARIGERRLAWDACHGIEPGEVLRIGPARRGVYAYLSVAGGIATPEILGSRAAHLVAGLGDRLGDGARLPVGPDRAPARIGLRIAAAPRFEGGVVRIVPGAQTGLYDAATRARFSATRFVRATRGNRQGVQLDFDGPPFEADGQRTILSEPIVPGDIQMTGDGRPFVLLPECQTTGGYPRIGSVLPEDLPIVSQAVPGTAMTFRFLSMEEAQAAHRPEAERFGSLHARVEPLVRDPRAIPELLGYQLISGVTAGHPPGDEEETR